MNGPGQPSSCRISKAVSLIGPVFKLGFELEPSDVQALRTHLESIYRRWCRKYVHASAVTLGLLAAILTTGPVFSWRRLLAFGCVWGLLIPAIQGGVWLVNWCEWCLGKKALFGTLVGSHSLWVDAESLEDRVNAHAETFGSESLASIEDVQDYIYIFSAEQAVTIVPKRCLSSPELTENFYRALQVFGRNLPGGIQKEPGKWHFESFNGAMTGCLRVAAARHAELEKANES